MNKSHEDPVLEANLEQQLHAALGLPSDPELAADWLLSQELSELGPEPLTKQVRDRYLRSTRQHRLRRTPMLGWALAASMVAVTILAVVLRTPEPAPLTEAEQFELALQTLDDTSKRALAITGRALNEHIRWPTIELEPSPYNRLIRSFGRLQALNSDRPIEPPKES
ncbi:MAG: hypothetical protein AAGH65_01200 [Pseudomonadota bacterium]